MDYITKILRIMIELHSTDRRSIESGNFPLNHDCILKVRFNRDCPLIFQYFTCREQDSGAITVLFYKLALVTEVNISSVDNLPDNF